MKIAVFSGRFDPPHLGHAITILKLCESHDIVLIPVLDYDNRWIEAGEAVRILKKVTLDSKIRYNVNLVHFGKISAHDYNQLLKREGVDQSLNNVIYYSGNVEVLSHMKEIGVKCEYIERSFDEMYSSTIIKRGTNG